MELPNELLSEILQYLNNPDLKKVRLVSRTWSDSAAEHLFTKIFISPHKLNLEVFQALSQHAVLRNYIRELVYELVYFEPGISMSDYTVTLMNQIRD